jgi:squalene-hopene/tetraprenyl-beta-curcumene cyclase
MAACAVLAVAIGVRGPHVSDAADAVAPKSQVPLSQPNLSLRNEVARAIARGMDWLGTQQAAGGFWSTADHPAVTALVLMAAQGEPARASGATQRDWVRAGREYVLSCVRPDGSIAGPRGELLTHNTALGMLALLASGREEDRVVIQRARRFLIGLQVDMGEKGKLDTPYDGGVGYGTKYEHSDLSNTLAALEALYHSRGVAKDDAGDGGSRLDWQAAIHFLQSCQNLPSHNREAWASDDPALRGGFVYYPGHSMAGETNLASGRKALRSYGSASYAGLLSYIYADLKRDDPRVAAVLEWLRAHYTLEENPGMGPQGLYYYFHTMSKALSLYGADVLTLADGRKVEWRREVALRLIDLQLPNGSWANDNGRWWEKDAALVTAYSVLALEMIHRGL